MPLSLMLCCHINALLWALTSMPSVFFNMQFKITCGRLKTRQKECTHTHKLHFQVNTAITKKLFFYVWVGGCLHMCSPQGGWWKRSRFPEEVVGCPTLNVARQGPYQPHFVLSSACSFIYPRWPEVISNVPSEYIILWFHNIVTLADFKPWHTNNTQALKCRDLHGCTDPEPCTALGKHHCCLGCQQCHS